MMKIAQFTALPMAVVAIKVGPSQDDKTSTGAKKKAFATALLSAIQMVAGQSPGCQEFQDACRETCANDWDFTYRQECYGNADNRCALCTCNDGIGDDADIVDLTAEIGNLFLLGSPCTATTCGYGDLTDACPIAKDTLQAAQDPCMENNQACTDACRARGSEVRNTQCWGNDASRCVWCECQDDAELTEFMPLECTNEFCPGSTCNNSTTA